MSIGSWLEERTGWRSNVGAALDTKIAGGPSFAHVFGAVLGSILVIQAVTGILLAMSYSPSVSAAWASVAYIEDQVALGWFIRGMHLYGSSAMVIVAGLYLLQSAVWGGYKKPRELVWILQVVILGVLMLFPLTGHGLPWDQQGYWATKVELGITASAPGGAYIVQLAQGGNDMGNLTLTRLYAIHALLLPALVLILWLVRRALIRHHGLTPKWNAPDTAVGYFPDQAFRDAIAIALAVAALIAYTVYQGGAPLAAPADSTVPFDARPEWFIRPLFQLRKYAGPLEHLAALGAPVVVGGFLIGLPFVDRSPDRSPRRRPLVMAALALGGVVVLALVGLSFRDDANDEDLAKRVAWSEKRAAQARSLALANGVPPTGGTAVFSTAPHWQARVIWQKACASCHEGDDRKGPLITVGYGSRAWIRGFLTDPSGDAYFGRTKLAKTDKAMKAVEQTGAELDALVEMVYAQSGAKDVDAKKVEIGVGLFDSVCSDCHEREAGKDSDPGPNLFGMGSLAHRASLIANPAAPTMYGAHNEMPAFAADTTESDRAAIATWLAWMQTATARDVEALGEP
ncbi:MAG: cytochrome b N-terminal domain-containing protein [Deltaproteobacteria bacterium]|nr:cytochrome b N-terminal domain-containing protein [Deltaproteobacteria bacterium]